MFCSRLGIMSHFSNTKSLTDIWIWRNSKAIGWFWRWLSTAPHLEKWNRRIFSIVSTIFVLLDTLFSISRYFTYKTWLSPPPLLLSPNHLRVQKPLRTKGVTRGGGTWEAIRGGCTHKFFLKHRYTHKIHAFHFWQDPFGSNLSRVLFLGDVS